MKPGPKRQLPSEKAARGTTRRDRDANVVEIIAPDALPQQPDWLAGEAIEVWQDDLGRVTAGRLVSEADTTIFTNYCNLQALVIRCFKAGEAPPIAALAEVRKMQELFGIGGARSRLQVKPDGKSTNPFARNGKRTG